MFLYAPLFPSSQKNTLKRWLTVLGFFRGFWTIFFSKPRDFFTFCAIFEKKFFSIVDYTKLNLSIPYHLKKKCKKASFWTFFFRNDMTAQLFFCRVNEDFLEFFKSQLHRTAISTYFIASKHHLQQFRTIFVIKIIHTLQHPHKHSFTKISKYT